MWLLLLPGLCLDGLGQSVAPASSLSVTALRNALLVPELPNGASLMLVLLMKPIRVHFISSSTLHVSTAMCRTITTLITIEPGERHVDLFVRTSSPLPAPSCQQRTTRTARIAFPYSASIFPSIYFFLLRACNLWAVDLGRARMERWD